MLYNKIFSVTLSLLLLYTISYKSLVTINYFTNQAEIIENFCINKTKPELNCNAKCHLIKTFVKVDNQENKSPFSDSNFESDIELLFKLSENQNQLSFAETKRSSKYPHFKVNLLKEYTTILSPPPKISA